MTFSTANPARINRKNKEESEEVCLGVFSVGNGMGYPSHPCVLDEVNKDL